MEEVLLKQQEVDSQKTKSSSFPPASARVSSGTLDPDEGKGTDSIFGFGSLYSFLRGKAGHIPQGQSQLHQAGGLVSFGWTMS